MTRRALLLLGVLLWCTAESVAQVSTVQITSPQGRLASSGAIRIVARATAGTDAIVEKVAFFVEDVRVGEDVTGPVFATEWVDENPFVPVTIRAEATDTRGRTAEHRITLPGLDVKDETSVSSVLLDVAILDPQGRHVAGLTREHFALREDDVVQAIELAEPSRTPTTVTMLVDTSQSMSSRFEFVRRATRQLASLLRPEDQLAVVPFARELGPMTGPTRDLEALTTAIGSLRTRGGTAIADAVQSLMQRLSNAPGRQIVVLITDGYDEHSSAAIEDGLAAARAANATLYTVGIGGVAGVSFQGGEVLRRLAAQTGGKAFFPARDAELPLVQGYIHDDIAHRYLLTYTPSNQERDGMWRAVTLRTGNPEHVIKTRDGYFAAAPAPIRPVIEFTALGAMGEAVVLDLSDIEVREDGVAQRVDSFQEAVAPVSILLALDESGSMRRIAGEVKAAALGFVDAVRDEDRLGVVTFSDTARLATDLTLSRAVPRMTIDSYRTDGGTALLDAIALSLERLHTVDGRRAVVVLTDGRDENNAGTAPGSRHAFQELLAKVQAVDAVVFAIGLGPNVDRESLERLANASGGIAFFPPTAADLAAQYARVVEELRRRYVLSYTSTNARRDGGWREVALSAAPPGVVLRSRRGYRAPAR